VAADEETDPQNGNDSRFVSEATTVQVSARVHYGCLAMLELAQRYAEERPVALREIAGRHRIPQPFLVQILQSLRAANLVTSTRGSGGGYRLAMGPEQICVLEIAEAIGCGEPIPGGEPDSGPPEGDSLRSLWQRADEAAREVLAGTTLDDLVQTCSDQSAAMFYI